MIPLYQKKILIVDDIPENLKLLGLSLKELGATILMAQSGRIAIDLAKIKQPDLILLDIQMPEMDGFEVCQRLKNDPQTTAIPIIFLTAKHETDDIIKGLSLGAVDYVTKPFRQAELIARVSTHIELYTLQQSLHHEVKRQLNEIRQKEELLVQQSKMAQMGEMLSAIAHQWRQPLNALALLVQDVKEAWEYKSLDDEYIAIFMSKSMKQIEHMSHTIDEFRQFFKPSKEQKQFSIRETIEKTFHLVEKQFLQKGIHVTINEDNFTLFAYEGEVGHVILNILNNAKDQILSLPHHHNTVIEITINASDKSVMIADHAGGIPENIIERIFEPYFTTKDEGKGTGIGLYMSKMIIERHCYGKISVHNSNDGAVFTLQF